MSKNGASYVLPDSPAGEQLRARLAEEKTLQALDHILARLDTVEAAIGKLADTMHQGPGMVAMVADMADEAYRTADTLGINVDERLRNALQLAEQLTAPAMVEKLNQLTAFTNQLPGLVAMGGDMVDEAYRRADTRGVSIDERLGTALELAEKLTAPAMVSKLNQLLELSEQAPGLIAMTGDMIDEAYRRADARGVSIDERLGAALTMAEKLTDPTMVAKLDDLVVLANNLPSMIAMTVDTVDEGLRQARENGLEPETMVEWASQFGRAMREAQETPTKKLVSSVWRWLCAILIDRKP